jgi:hypothetical protein
MGIFWELVQVDGSLYHWFEGRAETCVLLVFIDDATENLLQFKFACLCFTKSLAAEFIDMKFRAIIIIHFQFIIDIGIPSW